MFFNSVTFLTKKIADNDDKYKKNGKPQERDIP